MRLLVTILLLPVFVFQSAVFGQKSKNKKNAPEQKGPKVFEIVGDSLRTDSVVYYNTEIGFLQPDFGPKFRGKWAINVMRRQAKAVPDSLSEAYIEFYGDTLFTAYVGCNKLNGYYVIKGPTIKFRITDTALSSCTLEVESWFIKLIQERVSYFGIDEKLLYLKDVAYNIIFDCSRRKEEEAKSTASQK
jgi:hypothetical protein